MKHLLLLLTCFGLFLIPTTSFAASGACSGHGGVNCSAGRDYDGSVICNDGWTGSSVSYSSMIMCGSYSSPSFSNTPSCPLMSYYDSLNGTCKCMSGYIVEKDFLGEQTCVSANSVCHDQLGIMSSYNSGLKKCECDYGYTIYGGKCVSEEDRCTSLFGYGAKYNILGDQCECKTGYSFNGGRCAIDLTSDTDNTPTYTYTTPTTSCPVNSSFKTDGCYCNTGYKLSSDKSSCIAIICAPNSTLTGDTCLCNEGYVYKNNMCVSYTEDCKNVFGSFAYGVKGSNGSSLCYCSSGYEWNEAQTLCQKIINKPTEANTTKQEQKPQPDMKRYCKTTLGEKADFDLISGNCTCIPGNTILNGKCATKFFVGIPKSKNDLLNCALVGDIKTKRYYNRGSKTIKSMTVKNKYCFDDEDLAKKSGYKQQN